MTSHKQKLHNITASVSELTSYTINSRLVHSLDSTQQNDNESV